MQGNGHPEDRGSPRQGASESVNLLGISQTGKAESSNLSTVGSSPTSPAKPWAYGFTNLESLAYQHTGVCAAWLDGRMVWQEPKNALPTIYIDPQTGKEVSEEWWPDVQ